jgi:hypothetical protein
VLLNLSRNDEPRPSSLLHAARRLPVWLIFDVRRISSLALKGPAAKDWAMNSTAPVVSGLLGFFILACAYSMQYWAKRCHDELKEIKEELKRRS